MASMRGKVALAAGVSLAAFGLLGCSDVDKALFEPHRVNSQADAGSIHLAVAPPIPFNAVSTQILPTFSLTGDDAVKAAIPNTGYIEDRFFEMFSAAIGLGPPKSGVTGTKSDGTAPAAKAPDAKLADSGKSVLTTGDDKRVLKEDPMLQYAAGTALYQEVKLLERYVAYAAMRDRYKAFVVRMNIGIQPFARAQPYDMFSSIGFFARDLTEAERTCVPAAMKAQENRRQPYILPLLVTDNLEGISTAKSAEVITQLALAISVLAQGFAGEASFGYTRDRLKSVLGTELNSLMTVGRSADNVVQVRLGAASQPTSRYAMVPSNHTVTVLMLVPSEQFYPCGRDPYPPYVRVVMKSRLRDALTGSQLPYLETPVLQAIKPGLIDAGMNPTLAQTLTTTRANVLHDLMIDIQQQNRKKFGEDLSAIEAEAKVKKSYHDQVWLVLTDLATRSPFQTSVVTLCDPDKKTGPLACMAVTLPKPPPKEEKKPAGNTATGNTITTTITTTTVPPTPAKPSP